MNKLHRLNYFLISNSLQDRVVKSQILTSLSSDNSPLLLKFESIDSPNGGTNYWIFNKLILENLRFCSKLNALIDSLKIKFASLYP